MYDRCILETFEVGMPIDISDGTPAPPARFNKKLEKWIDNNHTGVITELKEPWECEPFGAVEYRRDDYPDRPHFVFRFNHKLGPNVCDINPIPEVRCNDCNAEIFTDAEGYLCNDCYAAAKAEEA